MKIFKVGRSFVVLVDIDRKDLVVWEGSDIWGTSAVGVTDNGSGISTAGISRTS